MGQRIDPRIHNSFLDANFWDDGGYKENTATARILALAQRGDIQLILPFSVKREIEHPNTPQDIKRLAMSMVFTEQPELTQNELTIRSALLELIQGNARPGKHGRDVLHLFEAFKYGGGYFVTKDARLLKRRAVIESRLSSLCVVRPSEFITYFDSHGA